MTEAMTEAMTGAMTMVRATLRRGRDRRRSHGERGTAVLSITLITPLILAFVLFVVGLGRMAHARQQVEAVAADAARAASLQRNTSQSASAAQTAARASLGSAGVSCQDLDVDVDVSSYHPGGRITVTVSCTTKLDDVALAGFPGHKTFTARSVVPIETWRSE
ncbi:MULTISPECIES: TadE/TadG family type IV pilus assembly protein [unclassified Nocardioides]|uniref:TadE/TadG family type IV pilus assembly protein n=1 Tax=unclassified Nocardioides TaxID=2615069 RepID=UPI0009F09D8B|nr:MULTISPECIES: TadE/TadG family type IV pilus assembly protein [unclassified Nocardioides]GAW48030.1 TadE family protein [Nocardioides sp. PD653-B2]GAW53667.1 TadE family protein [Nocardioides sp. PD653]